MSVSMMIGLLEMVENLVKEGASDSEVVQNLKDSLDAKEIIVCPLCIVLFTPAEFNHGCEDRRRHLISEGWDGESLPDLWDMLDDCLYYCRWVRENQ